MTKLPIENELEQAALYWCAVHHMSGFNDSGALLSSPKGRHYFDDSCIWQRFEPAAVYQPEPVEPTRLGAVVRTGSGGSTWVRSGQGSYGWVPINHSSVVDRRCWSELKRPITVLSEGVQL